MGRFSGQLTNRTNQLNRPNLQNEHVRNAGRHVCIIAHDVTHTSDYVTRAPASNFVVFRLQLRHQTRVCAAYPHTSTNSNTVTRYTSIARFYLFCPTSVGPFSKLTPKHQVNVDFECMLCCIVLVWT